MKIQKPILVLAIVLLSCSINITQGSGNLVISQTYIQPWTVSSGWAFTWHIDASTNPYMRGTDMRFTVHEIVPASGQPNILKLEGNLSRYIGLSPGATPVWQSMKVNTTYATYDVNTGTYLLTSDAFGDQVFFLPVNMQDPVALFKAAYSSQCNDSTWTITINETSRTYDAINIANAKQKVHLDFDSSGAVNNVTISWPNGTVKYRMILASTYNPNQDITRFLNILTIMSMGAIILIVVVVLLKKYKIKVKDVVSGKRPAPEPDDDELKFDGSDVPEDLRPEED